MSKDLYFLLWNFYEGTFCTSGKVCWRILHGGNVLYFWNSADSAVNSPPKDLYFLLQNFCEQTFCTSKIQQILLWAVCRKICTFSYEISAEGHFALLEKFAEGYSTEEIVIQYINDESFPLAAMASFFVFLRGSRARITSMKEKWLKPCEGMKGFFSSKCWTKRWRWREFRKLIMFP